LSGPGADGQHKPAELFPDSLVWAIVSVFIVGLGGTIGLMAVMKDARTFDPGLIIGLSLLSFVAMLAVEGVLVYLLLSRRSRAKETTDPWKMYYQAISLLLSRRSGAKETSEKSQLKAPILREHGIGNERALSEPSLSVTDHTTRTLEPAYRDRKGE
jgi:hypothetical protein